MSSQTVIEAGGSGSGASAAAGLLKKARDAARERSGAPLQLEIEKKAQRLQRRRARNRLKQQVLSQKIRAQVHGEASSTDLNAPSSNDVSPEVKS